jgi:hypothetical protein
MTFARTNTIRPLEDYLKNSAPRVHDLLANTHNKPQTDPSVGKTRKQAMEILGCA